MKRNNLYNNSRNHNNGDSHDKILQQSVEAENENKIDILLQNVNDLKQIGIDFSQDITDDKTHLIHMDKNFDTISVLMKQTVGKVENLLNTKTGRLSLYMILIILILFLLLKLFWK